MSGFYRAVTRNGSPEGAVNGVINITTKSARDTQGLFLESGGGTELHGFGTARYGGAITPQAFFRIYGKYAGRDGLELGSGVDAANTWRMGQGGFRLDWERSDANTFTLQGDLYRDQNVSTRPSDPRTSGGNVTGRWSHTFSQASDLTLQLYADRSHKTVPGSYNDVLDTYDLDFQHRLPTVRRHGVVWGASYRLVKDDFGPGSLTFLPRRLSQYTFSAFAQDEIALAADRLVLTLGSKIQRDAYTGLELQPSVRLAWNSGTRGTLWTSISRAVRTPSRLDRDLIMPPVSVGGPNFESEELLAYEVGYRARPHDRLFVAIASYYNDYDKIRSTEQAQPPAPIPQMFANGQEGESYGVELTADYRHTDWWRIQMGYTEVQLQIRPKPTSIDRTFGHSEAADSPHRFFLRSSLDLPGHLELNPSFRAVSRVKNPLDPVGAYAELDVRLAWQPRPRIQLSLVGQNLLHDRHVEFGTPLTGQGIERSVYAKATYRW